MGYDSILSNLNPAESLSESYEVYISTFAIRLRLKTTQAKDVKSPSVAREGINMTV